MIYVFEDKKDDLLSKLFCKLYDSCIFVYADGNGNLVRIVEDLLISSDDNILVYMDLIPDNINTVSIYKSLKRISRKNDFRLVVMPIVCAEYYFIKSLPEYLFLSDKGLKECINKEYYKDSELIEDSDRKCVKNFEKYCKLILLKNVVDCVRHSRKDNSKYGCYYEEDCLCDGCYDFCKVYTAIEKAADYVYQYPVFPDTNLIDNCNKINIDSLWEIHRGLVDDYNLMVDNFMLKDKRYTYTKIHYIKDIK